jgi:hypothetical protein
MKLILWSFSASCCYVCPYYFILELLLLLFNSLYSVTLNHINKIYYNFEKVCQACSAVALFEPSLLRSDHINYLSTLLCLDNTHVYFVPSACIHHACCSVQIFFHTHMIVSVWIDTVVFSFFTVKLVLLQSVPCQTPITTALLLYLV